MSDPITELGKLLQDAGATVKFGLRAQGHLPTIERMLDEGASWHAIGRAIGWDKHAACEHYTIHLWEEAKALRGALATAQAERSEALMECNCAVLERDAALQRAEQAEAALAQAQAERDAKQAEQESVTTERNEAVQGLRDCHMLARRALAAATREGMAKHLPHILRICERQAPEGTQMTSILRDEPIAQPPALPPLPGTWDVVEAHGLKTWSWRHNPMNDVILRLMPGGAYRVAVDVGWGEELPPIADLLIVLRHAEAAHLKLKGGAK